MRNRLTDLPLLVPRLPAFRLIGVGNTRGNELIREKRLDARKLGRKTLITRESLEAFAASLPPAGTDTAATKAKAKRR